MKFFSFIIFNSFCTRHILFYKDEVEILNISCSLKTFSVLHRERPTGIFDLISVFLFPNIYFISMPILHARFNYLVRPIFMERKHTNLSKFQGFALHTSVRDRDFFFFLRKIDHVSLLPFSTETQEEKIINKAAHIITKDLSALSRRKCSLAVEWASILSPESWCLDKYYIVCIFRQILCKYRPNPEENHRCIQ